MPSPRTIERRVRRLIAELAGGVASEDATELMVRINALALKLDRMGYTSLHDALMAEKRTANADGRKAYAAALQRELNDVRGRERDDMRRDPARWMHGH